MNTPGFCPACGNHNYKHDEDCMHNHDDDCLRQDDAKPFVTVQDKNGVFRAAMTELEQASVEAARQNSIESTRRECVKIVLQTTRPDPEKGYDYAQVIKNAQMLFEWEMNGTVPINIGAVANLRAI